MKTINYALIGAGYIGERHAAAIAGTEGARLAVVASDNELQAQTLAKRYGADWTTDYRIALARSDVDAVSICTPSGFHAEPAIAALDAGKHVLVEKPMDIHVNKADQMIAAAERAKRNLAVVFQKRFNPAMRFVKESIERGKLGRITLAEATLKWYRTPSYFTGSPWRGTWAMDGGGALMNQGIHFVDLLLWLVGDVAEVSAAASTLYHAIETEDTLVANLRFENGALGVIQATTAA